MRIGLVERGECWVRQKWMLGHCIGSGVDIKYSRGFLRAYMHFKSTKHAQARDGTHDER